MYLNIFYRERRARRQFLKKGPPSESLRQIESHLLGIGLLVRIRNCAITLQNICSLPEVVEEIQLAAGMRNSLVKRTVKSVEYRFQTNDTSIYFFDDYVRRTMAAVMRAGGVPTSGIVALPNHAKRWVVLRSPHVHKKSREKFWMVSHFRKFEWDAPASVDPVVPLQITRSVPPTVAIRMTESEPGLLMLRSLFEAMQSQSKEDES